MDLQQEYSKIKECIDRIDFGALREGFHPFLFALNNDNE